MPSRDGKGPSDKSTGQNNGSGNGNGQGGKGLGAKTGGRKGIC